jgi:hypothetical protein
MDIPTDVTAEVKCNRDKGVGVPADGVSGAEIAEEVVSVKR